MKSSVTVKSQKIGYYGFLIFALIFGLTFFSVGIHLLVDSDATITVNGVVEKPTLTNSSPFLLIGLASLGVFFIYAFKHYLGKMTEDSIVIRNLIKRRTFKWEDIASAKIIGFINIHVIKFYTMNGKSFTVEMDRPKFNFSDIFEPKKKFYRTEMWKLFESKVMTSD